MPPSRNAASERRVGVLDGLNVAAVFAGKISLAE